MVAPSFIIPKWWRSLPLGESRPLNKILDRRYAVAIALLSIALSPVAGLCQTGGFNVLGDSTIRYELSYFHKYVPHLPGFVVTNVGQSYGAGSQLALWIGGIRGRDTLVVFGYDTYGGSLFYPGNFSEIQSSPYKPGIISISRPSSNDALARSFEDVTMYYGFGDWFSDTNSASTEIDNFLTLRVKQTSFYWPVEYAKNILLINYQITNYGLRDIREAYFGLFFKGPEVSGGRFNYIHGTYGFLDSATLSLPTNATLQKKMPVQAAWFSSTDGRPNLETGTFDSTSVNRVSGVCILHPNSPFLKRSYNWWSIEDTTLPPEFVTPDFGPRKRESPAGPFRDWGRLGAPVTVEDKYYLMSNGELDYNQLETAVDHSHAGWLPPPSDAIRIVESGPSVQSLYSIGPVNLGRGQSANFTVAMIWSDSFHINPVTLYDKFDSMNPGRYLQEQVDFTKLLTNAVWAQWIYDNPGRDTDGDGYRGEFLLIPAADRDSTDTTSMDTAWIAGDGIPDFRGVDLPAEPEVRFTPRESEIVLEWNGLLAETTRDFFTGEFDFEGYRVYQGLAPRYEDLQLVASYDIENYVQFVLLPSEETAGEFVWTVIRKPFTLEEAKAAYSGGNPDWHPLIHSIDNPLFYRDSQFYFAPNDWNQSDLTDTMGIHKIYPGEPYPHTLILDSAFTKDTLYTDPVTGETTFYQGGELTPDGKRFKYFEYRMVLRNQLASQRTYLSVTAFDFGAPQARLPGLETNRLATVVEALAQDRVPQETPGGLDVIVYPNPYRIDGNYREFGFEGRGREGYAG